MTVFGPGELRRKLYQVFDIRALRDTQRDLWVHLDTYRDPQEGVARRLHDRITLSRTDTHQLLAGHNGSGKSTELFQLKRMLESQDEGRPYFTVHCDVGDDVDRGDLDFLDVLIAVLRRVTKELSDRAGFVIKPSYFKDRLGKLWKLLSSEVELQSLDLSAAFAKVSIAIKGSPDARRELRRVFEPDAGNWMQAANDLLADALVHLHNKEYDGLVVLVDDLDKIAQVRHVDGECSLAEHLFVRRAPQLTGLACHVVYTVPLHLAVSNQTPILASSYGGEVPVVPMVKLKTRPPERDSHRPGIDACAEMIDRRLSHVGVARNQVFESDRTLEKLILLSGGQPTELMTLVRESLLAALPITSAALDRLKDRGRLQYEGWLLDEHWTLLKDARADGSVKRTAGNQPAIGELLHSRALLQYLNRDQWFDVNPYLEESLPPS